MNLDLDAGHREHDGAADTLPSFNFGSAQFAGWSAVGADARLSPGMRQDDGHAAPCSGSSTFARRKHLVMQARDPLASMNPAGGWARIRSIASGIGAGSTGSVGFEGVLRRATEAALNDDAETAAGLANDALKMRAGAESHPVITLLVRLGHWKARRLDAFCELSRSLDPGPMRRRDARWSILHLSMESAVEAEQLRLVTAGRLAQEAMALSTHFFGPEFAGGRMAATLSASILYEHNQVDAADRLLRDRLVLNGSEGGVEGALRAYVVSARIAVARHQVPFAVLLLREAELLGVERGWPRLVATSLAERVRLLLEDGRMSDAEDCVKRLVGMPPRFGHPVDDSLMAREVTIALARLDLGKGVGLHAVSALRKIVADCLSRREYHVAVELQMLLACGLRALGRDDDAATEAMRALGRGATAGLYRTFLDGGEATRRLLDWLFERRVGDAGVLGELRPYVRNLLIGFPERVHPPATARTRHRSGESLSPRERHILALMSHGQSNKRIAKELQIAPETVKSHAKHILLKLAAQTRVEAVSRAHSLGII